MSQLTIQTQISGVAGTGRGHRRPMRTERMVSLRSSMPVGLVTLRHDVPQRINHDDITPEKFTDLEFTEATPEVDRAERARAVETPVRKGGQAPW